MAEPEQFEIGEIVTLISGGPDMTVSSVRRGESFRGEDEDEIYCVTKWFAGSKLQTGTFKRNILQKVEPK